MGAAFAQQRAPAAPAPSAPAAAAKPAANEDKNAFAVDVYRLIEGFAESGSGVTNINLCLSYERLIVQHYSLGADVDLGIIMMTGSTAFSFGLAAEGRYYPNANFDKFFLGATLGFGLVSGDGYSSSGLTTSLKMGYKIKTAKSFYMEPSLAYGIMPSGFSLGDVLGGIYGGILGGGSSGSSDSFGAKGWQCGLRLGFVF